MMAEELNIIRRRFVKSSMKIYGKGRSAQSSSHTDSRRSKSNGDFGSFQGFIQSCQGNSCFLYCNFIFPKVKSAFRGKSFHDVEDVKKNVTDELNAVPLEAYALSKNFRKD
jgi:hypothetical protein